MDDPYADVVRLRQDIILNTHIMNQMSHGSCVSCESLRCSCADGTHGFFFSFYYHIRYLFIVHINLFLGDVPFISVLRKSYGRCLLFIALKEKGENNMAGDYRYRCPKARHTRMADMCLHRPKQGKYEWLMLV